VVTNPNLTWATMMPTATSTNAIGTGVVLNDKFTTDKNGVTRGTVWDIGAYEYIARPTATFGAGAPFIFGAGPVVTFGQ